MIKKFSQFFAHLVAYGGFCIEDGIIYVWNDPHLFIPLNSFILFQSELYTLLGQDQTNKLLYWMGKIKGNVDDQVLIKRFGLKPSQIDDFLSAAAQDGFGSCEFVKPPNPNDLKEVLLKVDSTIARALRTYTHITGPVDYYFLGLIAAGGEVLYNINVTSEEISCVANGDKECRFLIKRSQKPESFAFLKKSGIEHTALLERSRQLYLLRKSHFKVLSKKEISFGDGSFSFRGVKGVIIAERMFVILDYVLLKSLGKKYEALQEKYAQSHIKEVYDPKIKAEIRPENIIEMLNLLSLFGLGSFHLVRILGNDLFVENKSNYYPSDHVFLFGRSKSPVDNFCVLLLKSLFQQYFKKAPRIKEIQCRAVHSDTCLFKVSL